ncbi:MAG: YncE family protein [Alphaproteobacteria bacterium]
MHLWGPVSGLIFVMNGESQDVTVIDPASAKAIASIPVGGVPEAAASAGDGRVYVNIEDTNEIAVIDIATRTVATRYALPECNEPTGIAYDPVTGLLISACHNNITKLIDAKTGADHGDFPIGAGADGAIFNINTRIGFVSCIDGTLTVYRFSKDGRPTVLQTIKTADGARTQTYNPFTDRLYLPAATVERDGDGRYLRAEKGFKIVVVGQD